MDPILAMGNPQQFNAYAYADNNPATKSDPTGLIATSCPDGECSDGHGSYGGIGGRNPATNNPVNRGVPYVFHPAKSAFDAPEGKFDPGKHPLSSICAKDGVLLEASRTTATRSPGN